jgi:hypothetical protein
MRLFEILLVVGTFFGAGWLFPSIAVHSLLEKIGVVQKTHFVMPYLCCGMSVGAIANIFIIWFFPMLILPMIVWTLVNLVFILVCL